MEERWELKYTFKIITYNNFYFDIEMINYLILILYIDRNFFRNLFLPRSKIEESKQKQFVPALTRVLRIFPLTATNEIKVTALT